MANEEREADKLAGEGSVSGEVKKVRKYKQSRLDQIMAEGGMSTTRGETPPQYGRSDQNMDEEGNQDTLQ